MIDAAISANGGDGVRSKTRATVQRSTVSGNTGDGVRTDRTATLEDVTVTGNGGNGVDSAATAKATVTSVPSVPTGWSGMKGRFRVVLWNCSATGNGTNPACGVTDECADLAAASKASVKETSAVAARAATRSQAAPGASAATIDGVPTAAIRHD